MIASPFLKWVGGKRALLPELREHFPRRIGTYYEPFLGGGAVFWDLASRGVFERAVLSDVNEELINAYRVIQSPTGVEELIQALAMINPEPTLERYLQVRDLLPDVISTWLRAARTIYLNRRGFNGLYRVNRAGRFNVPFGRNHGTMPDPELLRACSRALRGVELNDWDFTFGLDAARAGDCVYFDPPYVPLTPTSSFTAYSAGGFGDVQHSILASWFTRLTNRGVVCITSNSDTPRVRELYAGHDLCPVQVRRNIAATGAARTSVGELVIVGRLTRKAGT